MSTIVITPRTSFAAPEGCSSRVSACQPAHTHTHVPAAPARVSAARSSSFSAASLSSSAACRSRATSAAGLDTKCSTLVEVGSYSPPASWACDTSKKGGGRMTGKSCGHMSGTRGVCAVSAHHENTNSPTGPASRRCDSITGVLTRRALASLVYPLPASPPPSPPKIHLQCLAAHCQLLGLPSCLLRLSPG